MGVREEKDRFSDADRDRLWEIFDLVQDAMGYDAALVF